jgi:hypothetical protein
MALGDPYISVDELKSHAQVADVNDDADIDRVVRAVSRSIERFTGRQFNDAGSASARQFRATRPHYVNVDDFSTATGLVVKTGTDGTFPTTLTDYTLEPLNGVVDGVTGWPFNRVTLHAGSFPFGLTRPGVEITARWGWAAVPDDVFQAALIQAARIFGRRYSANGLVGQGDFIFRVSLKLDPDVEMMLAPYRRPQVA